MANKTYYERGDTFVDVNDKPAIIKKGNQLTFTDDFKAGGGADLAPATAETLGGVKVGNGLNVASDGTLSVGGVNYSTSEHLTGRKWIDGSYIYEKTFYFENGISFGTSGATVEENTDANIITNVWVSDGIHGYAPTQGSIEDGNLKVYTITGTTGTLANIKYLTYQYTKTTPAETNNTRTVKKSTSKKG